ncbi:FAD:protein FMN transferase [Pseudozobellia sp. WGM2]|uniref:FAD:protein FMN transferase n=1 Tax=Pseudozobellia sp. WGM2 TaxID=2787625 RepID=UPI001AE0CCF8|nr:FAD:protein FMN transferase [Pseudozobellia sp. WGM2]
MGSRFDITVVASDSVSGHEYIDMAVTEISRIENLISSWNYKSQTSSINKNAGVSPVQVDPELFGLIKRCNQISNLTDGAFDISYASMDKIWKFDGSMQQMPDPSLIKASVEKVGYHNIVLDSATSSIFLKLEGMKIGFGAIGKGYAADKAKALLMSKGVSAGIINASGDMNSWGVQPNGQPWQVAITNPLNKNKTFALLPLNNNAVVTSGNYEKYLILNGKRYCHIIDPRTGYPSFGISSVTIFAPSGELADALATAVFVMGKDVGIDRINQIPKVECIIIDEKGQISTSKHIEIENL